jgi:tetratricopeptide (TPR) repeat protein/TolB-like protein
MATMPPPTPQQVRAELDRLLDDVAFRRAPTHSRLLRFLVERKAAGDDGALCEAGIAMAVFQRDPALYDAEIDPIVRVSIGRLRDRLEKHYERFERVPETVITLPRGRYAPEFRRRAAAAAAPAGLGLAVMRTRNLTGDATLDAIAQGLSDRLSDTLVQMGVPRVIAPASVDAAQRVSASPLEIGRVLDASGIVETTLAPDGRERLRVSARLIRAGDAELAWAEVRTTARDNPYPGVDALFDAVLARFATSAQVSTPRMTAAGASGRAPLPVAARGRIESARMLIAHLDIASIDRARALLAEVTRDYPDAADAWALRGRACVRRLNYGDLPAAPLIAELEASTGAALALDREHVEALALRALIHHWHGDLVESESAFRGVLRAAPNHTAARTGHAWLLVAQGRFDEALAELDIARSFDPMSLNVLFNRAYVLSLQRRFDEARALFETGISARGESVFSLAASATNELWAGELDRADALFLRAAEVAPANAVALYGLGCVAAARGEHGRARELGLRARASGTEPRHCAEAELCAHLGDRAGTLAAQRQALAAQESGRLLFGVSCAYESLADDPELIALLAPLGLTRWCGVRRGGHVT